MVDVTRKSMGSWVVEAEKWETRAHGDGNGRLADKAVLDILISEDIFRLEMTRTGGVEVGVA
jgi:hypothetical protein